MYNHKYKQFAIVLGLVFGLLSFDAVGDVYTEKTVYKDYVDFTFPYPSEWRQRIRSWKTTWTCLGGDEMVGCTFNLYLPVAAPYSSTTTTGIGTTTTTTTATSSTTTTTLPGGGTVLIPYYCSAGATLLMLHEILIVPPECYVMEEE